MLQGKTLRDAIISASNCLSKAKQSVDELNIFPVPDGDTGTNMSMTLSAAARELARLENPTVSETADVASAALLRGARGNSGVILSPVSYTHLDVYKRQMLYRSVRSSKSISAVRRKPSTAAEIYRSAVSGSASAIRQARAAVAIKAAFKQRES